MRPIATVANGCRPLHIGANSLVRKAVIMTIAFSWCLPMVRYSGSKFRISKTARRIAGLGMLNFSTHQAIYSTSVYLQLRHPLLLQQSPHLNC